MLGLVLSRRLVMVVGAFLVPVRVMWFTMMMASAAVMMWTWLSMASVVWPLMVMGSFGMFLGLVVMIRARVVVPMCWAIRCLSMLSVFAGVMMGSRFSMFVVLRFLVMMPSF